MIEVKIDDPELLKKAQAFSDFRERCKNYLSGVGMNYDKFTVVDHDSYIGYVSESVIRDYLRGHLPNPPFKVSSWNEYCDMQMIYKAVMNNDESRALAVKNYFYDKCDIVINTPQNEIHIDVKTALTALEPTDRWDFLYPVIQAHKEGKDYTVLAYCVYEKPNRLLIKKVDIIGYCDNSMLSQCKLVKSGDITSHGTISQVDNYETLLGRDYKDIDDLIKDLILKYGIY